MVHPSLDTFTPEELLQQMKELLVENHQLKGELDCPSGLSTQETQSLLKALSVRAFLSLFP
jgi:hypothetical protein